jgi:hypothetical protein
MSSEYNYEKVLAPYYEVWLGDQPLEGLEHSLIQEVVFEDTSSGSDLLTITFQDPDFILIDSPMIVKATPVKFVGGWLFDNKDLFSGYISAADVSYPANGVPTLTITCMDKSFMMDRIDRKEKYKDMRYDQIATQVAQRNGLAIVTQNSGKVEETTTQSDKSDIQFLTDLAEELEWLVWVKDSTLYFLPPDFGSSPTKTYWWRRPPFNLIEFSPRVIQADTKDGIDDHDLDPLTGEPKNDIGDSDTPQNTLGNKPDGPQVKYDWYTGQWNEQ